MTRESGDDKREVILRESGDDERGDDEREVTLRERGDASDVLAWPGLKAGALAWLGAALAFEIFRPSRGHSQGLAWPQDGF